MAHIFTISFVYLCLDFQAFFRIFFESSVLADFLIIFSVSKFIIREYCSSSYGMVYINLFSCAGASSAFFRGILLSAFAVFAYSRSHPGIENRLWIFSLHPRSYRRRQCFNDRSRSCRDLYGWAGITIACSLSIGATFVASLYGAFTDQRTKVE